MTGDVDAPSTESVEFFGESFHVAERVGLMPLMRFATAAQSGIDANEMEALAAMHGLLQQCIHPADLRRFERHASEAHADGDELMEFVAKVMAVVGARPTGRSSDSSDGPRVIEPSSTIVSSSPDTGPARVIQMFNEQGRPDLALLVRRRQESLPA